MSDFPKVRILLVDDKPDRLKGLRQSLKDTADVVIRHPLDVTSQDLQGVDLVSVDEYLGDDWEHTMATEPYLSRTSTRNLDGIAVAASFRSQIRRTVHVSTGVPNFAVSLHTAELAILGEDLPSHNRESLTAAQHDLDWVFEFNAAGLGSRFVQLALAVRSAGLAASAFRDDSGAGWLALPDENWNSTALEQIEVCRPPAHALAENTQGRSYLRWLAQRILPYPTFLLDEPHSANLLGIALSSFEKLNDWAETQSRAISFAGPLNAFLGRRWWRAGWQQLLADAGVSSWDSAEVRAAAIGELTGLPVVSLSNSQPVVVYDADGAVVSIDVDANDAVRLQADGWPVYADDPWGELDDVRNDDRLNRLVSIVDRPRLAEK